VDKIPQPLSEGEEMFAMHCAIYAIPVEREFMFHATRKWRLDFAIPEKKIGIEIEGGTWNGGRHTRPKGYENDARKYNACSLLGWRLFRFTKDMVVTGEAIDSIREALA
jgi:very-short-patch-repair endonuclease